jgi:hypothetical protein
MTVESFGSGENQSKPFYQVWIDAVTKPTAENYSQIVSDPKASLGTALLWLAGAGFINSLVSGTLRSVFDTTAFYSDYLGSEYTVGTSFLGVIGGAFASIFLAPLGALIFAGVIHLVSRVLGGSGSFEKYFYGFAAFWVPISLINAVIGGIPVINCLSVIIGIYALVLNVLANQAVHGYETWKAVVASLGVPLLLFLILFACIMILVIMGLASMGPLFEDLANQLSMIMLAW